MTVSRPCYFGNLLLGVVGVDVNLAYILEDVTYYQDSLASYTFLIDNKGGSHENWGSGSDRLQCKHFCWAPDPPHTCMFFITEELAGLSAVAPFSPTCGQAA